MKRIWDKVFKTGPSKVCGRQPSKNLKGYGMFKQKKKYFNQNLIIFSFFSFYTVPHKQRELLIHGEFCFTIMIRASINGSKK